MANKWKCKLKYKNDCQYQDTRIANTRSDNCKVCKRVFQYLFISFCYFSDQRFPTNVCEKVSVREPVEECQELPREACHLQQRQTPDERCQLVTREECTTVQEVVPVTQCQDVTVTLCQETPSDTGNNSGNQQVCTSTDFCSN